MAAARHSPWFQSLHALDRLPHSTTLPEAMTTISLKAQSLACRPGRIVLAVVWQAPDTMPSASPARTIIVPK